MDVLKFGFRYWKRNLGFSILTQLMGFTALGADLLLPLLTALLIDHVILDSPRTGDSLFDFLLDGSHGQIHTMELFWSVAWVFVALLFLKLILIYAKNVFNQKLGLNLETDLRLATFHKLMELDSSTISEYNTGELLTTINSDTIMFKEMFCRIIPAIFDSLFVLAAAVVLLGLISPYLLLIPLLMIPVFVFALIRFKKLARMNFRHIRDCNSDMNLKVQENIEAVRLVRAFTNEAREKEKFDEANQNLKESYISQVRLSASFEAAFSAIRQCAYIGGIAISAILVMNGQIMVGYLGSCASYILKIMDYISMVNNMVFQMQQQIVSGYKMMHFMECESRIPDGTEEVGDEPPHIRFRNASVKILDKTVLQNIDLDIPYGKTVGIVGGTGSGKSTLLESLIRIHDVSEGEIHLNGTNIREYSLDSLRRQFAFVFQDVFLFSNTIDSNICYANSDAGKEAVTQAAKHAQAHDFITGLEEGYDTIVGERGLGISGGQKQRVSIARALLKNAPILILDDSTSALDVETEKRLLRAIRTQWADKTLLISAHRMSSVADCDEILYLLDGAIAERGTFEELMALNGHFASVYRIQETQKKETIGFDQLAEGGMQ